MNFIFYDLIFLAVFSIGVALFLWKNNKKLGREGVIFLYRTQIGIKIIDKISKKYKKILKFLSYVIVCVGYILMAIMLYFLIQLVNIFAKPEYVKLIKIPPLMPLIPYLPKLFQIEWLPPFYFTYWIIIIGIVAIVHEGFHGIYARLYGIKVKSTGFGFLGPILSFFVEPDEKKIRKAKIFNQLSILGAGVFANILTAIVFFFILILFFNLTFTPAGALFNTYTYSQVPISSLENISIKDGKLILDGMNMTQIEFNGKSYFIWDEHLNSLENYEQGHINLYQDQPAICSGFQGAIIKINGVKIKNQDDLEKEMDKYQPGEIILIETKNKTSITEYKIKLGEDYEKKGRAVLGIGVLIPEISGIRGFLFSLMNSFRNPAVQYEPIGNSNLIEFIYYLIWWIVLVNIGVGLFNILPVGMVDGGRYWYLTVLAITKNEKFAKASFIFITRVILLIFVLLMVLWTIGII